MAAVTSILQSLADGSPKPAEELLPLVYEELRRLAACRMSQEAPGQTLQPTALVHEAWLRLSKASPQHWDNRAHFFSAAAESMRRILIERARRRQRIRHGGGQERVNLEEVEIEAPADDDRLLQVHEALDLLAREDSVKAEIVKLKFFTGLEDREIASLLGIGQRTVERHWAYSKAWLFRTIHTRAGGMLNHEQEATPAKADESV